MSEHDEFLGEFIIECEENLDQLDQDLVALENDPRDPDRLASIFRTVHTIKGTCGFFGFSKLGALAHDGEHLLGKLRDGTLVLSDPITSGLLELVDAIRDILAAIQQLGTEGARDYQPLSAKLIRLASEDAKPDRDQPTVTPIHRDMDAPSIVTDENVAYEPIPAAPPTPPTVDTEAIPPTSSPPAEPTPGEPVRSDPPSDTVRVDVGLLDRLVQTVGELVLARNRLANQVEASGTRDLYATANRIGSITTDLQEAIMKTRMQPMAGVWSKFPRIVRDLARKCGKEIDLGMQGMETELDRSLLEAIRDPLTHLIRNAIDHGIESPADRERLGKPRAGRLELRAYHARGMVHIEISDDGKGIDAQRVTDQAVANGVMDAAEAAQMSDLERLQLIFRPGLSTADRVTAVSGRGVGMDVVRTNIEQMGGTVELQSRSGHGTTVRILIPLTLAILPAQRIEVSGHCFVIPQANQVKVVTLTDALEIQSAIEMIGETALFRSGDELLPLVDLASTLALERRPPIDRRKSISLVVVQAGTGRLGLVVDQIQGNEEIVVTPLDETLQTIRVFSGATVLGDGQIALILDVAEIARREGIGIDGSAPVPARNATAAVEPAAPAAPSWLLCELNDGQQVALPVEQVARIEAFPCDGIEQSAGRWVVQYRGELMPLTSLSEPNAGDLSGLPGSTVRVVVHRCEGRNVGLIVPRIIDIVAADHSVTTSDDGPAADRQRATPRRGVVGSTIINQRATDIVDVHRLVCENNGGQSA